MTDPNQSNDDLDQMFAGKPASTGAPAPVGLMSAEAEAVAKEAARVAARKTREAASVVATKAAASSREWFARGKAKVEAIRQAGAAKKKAVGNSPATQELIIFDGRGELARDLRPLLEEVDAEGVETVTLDMAPVEEALAQSTDPEEGAPQAPSPNRRTSRRERLTGLMQALRPFRRIVAMGLIGAALISGFVYYTAIVAPRPVNAPVTEQKKVAPAQRPEPAQVPEAQPETRVVELKPVAEAAPAIAAVPPVATEQKEVDHEQLSLPVPEKKKAKPSKSQSQQTRQNLEKLDNYFEQLE